MIVNEDLEFSVVEKFSYGWLDIQNLKYLIPKQCELKGDVDIVLLSNRYVLNRASRMEYIYYLGQYSIFHITIETIQ